jgi:predicted DNA-binding protein
MSEADKVPVNLRLPRETALRLKVHALAEDRAAAEIVAELIERHLTRYALVEQPGNESAPPG